VGPTFDAILALHQGDPAEALARMTLHLSDLRTWDGGEWRPWYAALWAEAAVLAGDPAAAQRLADARPMVARNRSRAPWSSGPPRPPAIATGWSSWPTLARTGCRYQAARTLVLAGGTTRPEAGRPCAAGRGAHGRPRG
jgi:hypothetical protein